MHSTKNSLVNRCFAVLGVIALCCTLRADELPTFSLSQEQRDELAGSVIAALRSVQQQGGTALTDYLQGVDLATLDQPEPDESADAVAGVSLSKPFFGNQRAFDRDRLLDGVKLVRSNDEYKVSIALYSVIEQLLADQAIPLIQWLAGRATRSPATRCDKVILASLPNEFTGFTASFWNGSRALWNGMLTAKNPVYRLIALRNARFFEPDRAQLLRDYQSGLHEKNTALENAAFEALQAMTGPAPRTMLQGFLNEHHPANDGTMPESFDINAAIQDYLNPATPP